MHGEQHDDTDIPALIAYMKNHPNAPPVVLAGKRGPRFPFVFAMQKVKRPMSAGVTINDFAQKNLLSWYGRRELRAKCAHQRRKKHKSLLEVMPCDTGM